MPKVNRITVRRFRESMSNRRRIIRTKPFRRE